MINRYLNTRIRTRDLSGWAGNNLVTGVYSRGEKKKETKKLRRSLNTVSRPTRCDFFVVTTMCVIKFGEEEGEIGSPQYQLSKIYEISVTRCNNLSKSLVRVANSLRSTSFSYRRAPVKVTEFARVNEDNPTTTPATSGLSVRLNFASSESTDGLFVEPLESEVKFSRRVPSGSAHHCTLKHDTILTLTKFLYFLLTKFLVVAKFNFFDI